MSKWRLWIIVSLVTVPLLLLLGVGSWRLWTEGWFVYAWWPMSSCYAAAVLLAWWWQRKALLIPDVNFDPPLDWTDHDKNAWTIVEQRAEVLRSVEPEKVIEMQFYVAVAQDMAEELARFYHPKSADPVGSLTIPELLSVIELASHDLNQMIADYLPGGHIVTIDNWRHAGQIGKWYQRSSNAYWGVSAVLSPLRTTARFAASKVGLGLPFQMLQQNLTSWFVMAYVNRIGHYLILLNSGRLRVGVARYRELMSAYGPLSSETAPMSTQELAEEGTQAQQDQEEVGKVTLIVLGQVKAGKSSLVNSFLQQREATVDVLPATETNQRYECRLENSASVLSLVDTVGYSHEGARLDLTRETSELACQSDLIILATHARDPAKDPDIQFLRSIRDWFQENTEVKMPPILAVVTHIDLLSPAMEWEPPYDWNNPSRPKEHSIADACEVVREQLGHLLVDIIPVCLAEGRVYGVEEYLLPRIVTLLGEARAICLLRCLRNEADSGQTKRVVGQLLRAGRQLFGAALGPK